MGILVVAYFLGKFGGVVARLQEGPVGFAHLGRPTLVEGFQVHANQAIHELVGVVLAVPQAEDAADFFGTVLLGNVFHERVALLVCEEHVALPPSLIHGFEGDEAVGEHGVAEDHFVDSIAARGGVFGHALHQPSGRLDNRAGDAANGAFVNDVVLENVGQLVDEDVAELVEIAGKGDDHAEAQRLGKAGHAGRQKVGKDVGLLELVVRLIDDDRRPVRKLVVQDLADVIVALFEVLDCLHGQILKFGLKVKLDVLAFEYLPLEVPVADLVFPEPLLQLRGEDVLGAEVCGAPSEQGGAGEEAECRYSLHGYSPVDGGELSGRLVRGGRPSPSLNISSEPVESWLACWYCCKWRKLAAYAAWAGLRAAARP